MLSLIPLPYRLLAIALLIVATFAAGWVKGNDHGTAKLTAFVAKEATEASRISNIRQTITQKVEADHAKKDAATVAKYDAALRLLHANAGAKPVPVAATICNDQAADNRLSDAIADYLAGVRSIIASERAKVAGLGKVAELQTGTLVEGQDWLTKQEAVK